MVGDIDEFTKSRPWYLTWRVVIAVLVVCLVIFLLIPSKKQVARSQANKIYQYCLDETAPAENGEVSKYADATCACARDFLEEKFLDGDDPKKLSGLQYASITYTCSVSNSAITEDLKALEALAASNKANGETRLSQPGRDWRVARKTSPGVYGRIEQGDYVWSDDFIRDELPLFRAGLALRRAITEQCPAAISSADHVQIENFLGALQGAEVIAVMQGRRPLELETIMAAALADPAILQLSRSHIRSVVEQQSCTGPQMKATATNVARMLSGRRPAFGTNTAGSTLVLEKQGPVEPKHAYDNNSTAALTSRGARQLDRDYRGARKDGLAVLECHYDEDPADEYRAVQYYWAIRPLTNIGYQVPHFAEAFQRARQQGLNKANGRKYTHPFTTFGSPRLECPARQDSALGSKRIYAPRSEVSASSSEVPLPGEPEIVKKTAFTLYDYGQAPENFVPPIPDELPRNTLHLIMEKTGAGALSAIEVQPFGPWSLTREYPMGSAKQEKLNEDLIAISKEKPRVVVCKYLSPRRGVTNVSRHWYKRAPKTADPKRLTSRMADHPVLVIKGVRETCPATYQ
ncbi:MAG: hypothetical protein HRU11_07070 [Parvularculaceae bacterium]|nr:hypothetical protein [Parvularculaceae bacterium]